MAVYAVTLSNPAYHQLLIQLAQAKAHLEAVKSISHELYRDGMMGSVDPSYRAQAALDDMLYMELLVRERARA